MNIIRNREVSFGFASASRGFLTVAILTIAACLTVLATEGGGQTITVTTCNDVVDFSGYQVSDLPGPDGKVSFREATIAANSTPGPQTIAFAIPIADFWLFTDVALLKSEQGAFFLVDSGTTVDFTTQTTNIGNTNTTGLEVMMYNLAPNWMGIPAIFVKGNNCVIKGLGMAYQSGYGVQLKGNNNRVIGSDKGSVLMQGDSGEPIPTGNIVGGTVPGEGNNLTGLRIGGPADNNVVIGNTIIGINGVDVIASTQYGIPARNNRIGGPTPAERNVISGAGRFGEEGYPYGEQVSIVDADGTIVEGNYIGTTIDGMARYPQQIGTVGVEVRDSRGTTVRGNLIAGFRTVGVNHYNGQIFGWAVLIGATNASTYDTVVEGNTIGLAADGVTPIVTRQGITVSPMTSLFHAFRTRIANNHIAGVETSGIAIGSNENGVTLTGNSIHDSGLLGIDLFYNFNGIGGVTLNDAGDVDEGGNGLQNFPVLQSAGTNGSSVTVQGTLDSSPTEQFTVEFFSNPSCDPSGYGEGGRFLGSTTVTTDGAGRGTFSTTLTAVLAAGERATATARRSSTGDTSEFSACVAVTTTARRTAFDYDGDGKADPSIFRPSNGVWYLNRSTAGLAGLAWGIATDKIVPADYDGDGKTDVAVFRPSEGRWYIFNSSTSTFSGVSWGLATDIPAPGDFDNDGRADVAIFRPSDGNWWINRTTQGSITQQFGQNGDLPVVGDYDGDGRSDIGIFRPSDGVWFIRRSMAGDIGYQFGLGTDKVTPADYDGDGKTDISVYRPSEGKWYIAMSGSATYPVYTFGVASDIPSPGDYDGDGRADIAIFRPSDGNWWINRTTAGLIVQRYGQNGDKPTPNAFGN